MGDRTVAGDALLALLDSYRLRDEYAEVVRGRDERVALVLAELRRSHVELVETVVAKHGLRVDWDYADYLLGQAAK